jgi:O-antigen ligase
VFVFFCFGTIYENASVIAWLPINLKFGLAVLSLLVGVLAVDSRLILPRNTVVVLALFTLFVTWATVSLLWSPTDGYGQSKILHLTVAGGWLLIAPAVIITKEPVRTRRFITAILLVTLPFAASSLVTYVTTGNALVLNVANYITASRPLGFTALSLAYFTTLSQTKSQRFLLVGVLLSILGVLLVTGARGPFVATVTSTGLYLLWEFREQHRDTRQTLKRTFRAVGVSIFFFGLLTALVVQIGGRTTVYRLSRIASDTSISYRFDFYQSSINLFAQQPLFGHGIGSFAQAYTRPPNPVYPHNIFLEAGAELGLIGIGIFVLLLFRAVAPAWQRHGLNVSREQALFSMMVFYMLLNAMVSGDFYTNNYLYMALGATTGIYTNRSSAASSTALSR